MQGSKVSKGARKRGQLSSLLVEAYQNREALEEKIAEGRRNRKEAGNKYGAFRNIQVCGSYRLTFRKAFNNYCVMAMRVIYQVYAPGSHNIFHTRNLPSWVVFFLCGQKGSSERGCK